MAVCVTGGTVKNCDTPKIGGSNFLYLSDRQSIASRADGVLGAGIMGNGIAQVSAIAGYEVILYDIDQKFIDRGLTKRILLGVGLQDVLVSGLTPMLDIDILGTSSDHLVVDVKKLELKVGNELEFDLNYGALLSAMTSPYIIKKYK